MTISSAQLFRCRNHFHGKFIATLIYTAISTVLKWIPNVITTDGNLLTALKANATVIRSFERTYESVSKSCRSLENCRNYLEKNRKKNPNKIEHIVPNCQHLAEGNTEKSK